MTGAGESEERCVAHREQHEEQNGAENLHAVHRLLSRGDAPADRSLPEAIGHVVSDTENAEQVDDEGQRLGQLQHVLISSWVAFQPGWLNFAFEDVSWNEEQNADRAQTLGDVAKIVPGAETNVVRARVPDLHQTQNRVGHERQPDQEKGQLLNEWKRPRLLEVRIERFRPLKSGQVPVEVHESVNREWNHSNKTKELGPDVGARNSR